MNVVIAISDSIYYSAEMIVVQTQIYEYIKKLTSVVNTNSGWGTALSLRLNVNSVLIKTSLGSKVVFFKAYFFQGKNRNFH